MDKEVKLKIIEKHRINDKDVGSCQVQVAILTQKIKDLSEHLKLHKKDQHTRYGLLNMVSRRRRLINYLKRDDGENYKALAESLELK